MAKPKLVTTTLDFKLADPGTNTDFYIIDIARCLSLLNRRSYRQGHVYSVDYIELANTPQSTASADVWIWKLWENYNTIQAWKLGFDKWKHQRHLAMQDSDLEAAKWADFKIYYDRYHMDPSALPNHQGQLLPIIVKTNNSSFEPCSTHGSEWAYAELTVNEAGATDDTYNLGMLGGSDDSADYGALIEAWASTRPGTMAPDPLQADSAPSHWIMQTGPASSDLTTEVIDDVMHKNDFPPYANEIVSANQQIAIGWNGRATGTAGNTDGGKLHALSTTGTTSRPVMIPGGLFPCGLVSLAVSGDGSDTIMRIHLTRGQTDGVASEFMGDFV